MMPPDELLDQLRMDDDGAPVPSDRTVGRTATAKGPSSATRLLVSLAMIGAWLADEEALGDQMAGDRWDGLG